MDKIFPMEMAPVEFTDWFSDLLQSNKLGIREAARKIGVSHPTVSDIQKGVIPSEGHCVKIAIAFDLPVEMVLSKAGYLDTVSQDDEETEQLVHLVSQMPKEEQEEVLAYAKLRANLREQRSK